MELTSSDRRLISALKKDGRATITELSGILGISRATVQTRMERLIRNGVIRRFTVEVDPVADQEVVRAIMTIEIQGSLSRSIIRNLRQKPEITTLHTTNGAWDLVAHIETASLQDFDRVLREVREIKGVLNSETSLLLDIA